MKSLLRVTLLSTNLFVSAEEVYTVQGTVEFNGFRPEQDVPASSYVTKFSVSVSNCLWIIRSFRPDSDLDYFETGTDGRNVFHLNSFETTARANAQLNASSVGTVASAKVDPGVVPRIYEAPANTVIWLTFASRCYLDSVKLDGKLDRLLDYIGKGSSLNNYLSDYHSPMITATWERNAAPPRLASSIVYYDDGQLDYWESQQASQVLPPFRKRRNPPYDHGFKSAELIVSTTTNVGSVVLPLSATFSIFAPRQSGVSSNDIYLLQRFRISVTNTTANVTLHAFLPAPPGSVQCRDNRFAAETPKVLGVCYDFDNAWLSDEAVRQLEAYKRCVHESRLITTYPRQQEPPKAGELKARRNLIRTALLLITLGVPFVAYMLRRGRKR
jgi:hypothetical protein